MSDARINPIHFSKKTFLQLAKFFFAVVDHRWCKREGNDGMPSTFISFLFLWKQMLGLIKGEVRACPVLCKRKWTDRLIDREREKKDGDRYRVCVYVRRRMSYCERANTSVVMCVCLYLCVSVKSMGERERERERERKRVYECQCAHRHNHVYLLVSAFLYSNLCPIYTSRGLHFSRSFRICYDF